MKNKKWLSILLAAILVVSIIPMTAFASSSTVVYADGKILAEGENSVGEGTATLDKTANTLTLEGIAITKNLDIQSNEEFTVIVKGENSIKVGASASSIITNAPKLNIKIQEGAVLTLGAEDGNNIYQYGGSLNISGPGKLVAVEENIYPSLYSADDIVFGENLVAEITAEDTNAVYSEGADIVVDSSDVTIKAGIVGLFAQSYDEQNDTDYQSSVTVRNSTLNITSYDNAICSGLGGVIIDNSAVEINSDVFSMYTYGDIVIKGDKTDILANDYDGINADNILKIEGGNINLTSVSGGLFGYNGIEITGGTTSVSAEDGSAILANNGLLSITGENTHVNAISNAEDTATIRNVRDGGIYLDADVKAENKAGGKPFEGVKKDKTTAITLGEGYEAFGLKVYTEEGGSNAKSYFVLADSENNEPVTGAASVCSHEWAEPVWEWTQDNTGAKAIFTCTKDSAHTITEQAVVTSATTDPTCAKEGQTVYTATVTFDGQEYTAQKTITIDATGEHDYVDGKCSVCGAADPDYKPVKPEDPNSPEDEKDPEEDANENDGNTDAPKTGDEMNYFIWLSMIVLAAGALLATIAFVRTRKIQ